MGAATGGGPSPPPPTPLPPRIVGEHILNSMPVALHILVTLIIHSNQSIYGKTFKEILIGTQATIVIHIFCDT